jgi:hypothetical protein
MLRALLAWQRNLGATMLVRAAATLASLLLCGQALASPLRTVALTGQLVPGTTNDETFKSLDGQYQINSLGKVAFTATHSGSMPFAYEIWTDGSGSLQRLFRHGDQAPGLSAGITFSGFSSLSALNRSGQLAFYHSLSGPGVTSDTDESMWSTTSGELALIARDGDAAPGLPAGSTYFYVWNAATFNDAGQLVYSGGIRDPGGTSPNGGALWRESGGVRSLIVATGDHIPGMPPGATLRSLALSVPMNRAGEIVFTGSIDPPNTSGVNGSGIFAGSPGNMRVVVMDGMQAAGTPPGDYFAGMGLASQNNRGQIAFRGFVAGPDVNATNNFGIWREHSGTIELVYRTGEQLPDVSAGVGFSHNSLLALTLNDSGHLLFSTYLQGPGVTSQNDRSIWVHRGEEFDLVARGGGHAEGIPGDAFYAGFFTTTINATGQIVFATDITGPGISYEAGNNRGIWGTDAAGNVQLIARTGDAIEVAPSDWRTPTSLSLFLQATNTGRPTGFNDRGQVAFAAMFSDGTSGLFVSDAVATIPGDFNRDGSVTGADLTIWRAAMATPTTTPNLFADGDFDGDVDGDDFLVWQRNLGATTPTPTVRAVPEPSAALLAIAAVLFAPRSRARHDDPI